MTARVFWIQGPRRQARLKLQGSFFVIGRAEAFPVFQDDPSISRDHAVVVATGGGIRVRDLGARNGVVLNGERIARYAEVAVGPGDVLQVGSTRLGLLTEEEAARASEAPVDDEEAAPAAEVTVDPDGCAAEEASADPEELAALARTQGFEGEEAAEETHELDAPPTDVGAVDEAEVTQVLEDEVEEEVAADAPEGGEGRESGEGGPEEPGDEGGEPGPDEGEGGAAEPPTLLE